jgi:hypothetical protein
MAALSTSSTRIGADILLTCSGSAETESLNALQEALLTAHASDCTCLRHQR